MHSYIVKVVRTGYMEVCEPSAEDAKRAIERDMSDSQIGMEITDVEATVVKQIW